MKKPTPKRAKVTRDALPPWLAEGERDKELMHEWVNRQLDEQLQARLSDELDERTAAFLSDMTDYRVKARRLALVDRAYNGDGEALNEIRLALPEFAQLLNPPPLKGQGNKISSLKKRDAVQYAIDDAVAIRALWKKHYGKSNRPDKQLSAEEIAARRWLDNKLDDGKPVREDDEETRLAAFLEKIHARKHGGGPSGKRKAAKRLKSHPKK